MKRLASLLLLLPSLLLASPGSGVSDYLKLRKQNGVTDSITVEALGSLVGSKVVEIRGTVKGTFRSGDRAAVMLEKAGGEAEVIDAPNVPEWLVDYQSPARLLVKAVRSSDTGALQATLLAAAPEDDVAASIVPPKKTVAAKPQPKPVVRQKVRATTKTARKGSIRSRSRAWSLPASEVTPIYAAFIKKQNPRLPNSEALRIAQSIVGFSIRYGVDARLIIAIVMVESGFNPSAISHAGAMGLGQLMPGTAQWMGVSNPYDSVDNVYGMVKLMRQHIDKYRRQTGKEFEALVLALAAYNAGEGAVRRHGGIPPYRETQSYVRKVMQLYYTLAGVK